VVSRRISSLGVALGILLYVRLIGYTAGTLLMLFWMVVILGYRRQRNFERVFFFLCLALFCYYSGSLLALNAQIHYAQPPVFLDLFSQMLLVLGLWTMPGLALHLHVEYARERELTPRRAVRYTWLVAAYLPLLFVLVTRRALSEAAFDFLTPIDTFGLVYKVWLLGVLALCSWWQWRFSKATSVAAQRQFHQWAAVWLATGALLVFDLHLRAGTTAAPAWSAFLSLHPIPAFGALVYYVEKHNFLQIGRQRNLVYAVVVTFLALLYLSVIRRVGMWLEPVLPPEATAAILVFVLVAFFEPLQRSVNKLLRATARDAIERAHKILGPIQQVARLGNVTKLQGFIETWVRDQLELADVRLTLFDPARSEAENEPAKSEFTFLVRQAGRSSGSLEIKTHGAMLSGETRAALELLCDQLPGAIDLCRAVEEKVRLERELAERERLAGLGQMAASISHNLKNPLGSIKTILQVQLENPEMPESLKSETKMVLSEISRLSNKLAQLLQFSRPTVLGETTGVSNMAEVAVEVTEVLRHEAERNGMRLESCVNGSLSVTAGREAVNDILSNLIVNALEACAAGGLVSVSARRQDGKALICVEDDGSGIAPALREKVLQPFFTTKTQGTGLGLAIVERRVREAGGRLEMESPAANGRGTRFSVWLPLREDSK
jgi:signal transduction histidine kinase